MLDRVEQQLTHRFEQQRADVLPIGVGERVGRHLHHKAVLVSCPPCQPGQRRRQSHKVQRGRKQLQAQRSCGGARLIQVTFRPHEQVVRTGPSLFLPRQVSLEVQGRADEQLLETVVQRLGELLARVLLGERQV